MARNNQGNGQNRLSGPEVLDIDPDTGRPFPEDMDTSDLESDQDKNLNDIIGEFGAADNEVSYKASITRIPSGFQRGQKEPWLFECDASQIVGIRTMLRDTYRGGNFRIRVYRTTNKGTKLYRQMDYSIEPPAATPSSTNDPKYDALSNSLERTQAQLLALAERLSNPTPQITTQPVQAFDPLVMMREMSAIFANLNGNRAPAGDSLDTFLKASEFIQNIRGDDKGGASEDNIYSIIKAALANPALGEILQARNNQPQRRMRQLPNGQMRQTPMQQPQAATPPEPVSGNDPQALGNALQANIRYLISKAERNSDPGLYAEWLLDNTEPNIIVPMLNDPNLLNQLCTAFPRMVPYRAWFEELVSFAKEAITGGAGDPSMNGSIDAGQPAVTAMDNFGRTGGDQSHVETHGPAGEGSPA